MVGRLIRWFLFIAVVAALFVVGRSTWSFSDEIRDEFLSPRPAGPEVRALAVGEGTVTLNSTPQTARSGIFDLVWDDGRGRLGEVLEDDGDRVTRELALTSGDLSMGTLASIDVSLFGATPADLGIEYVQVLIEGELGLHPSWQVEGAGDTWVVFAHNRGEDARREALRMLPWFQDRGYPILVPTFRNDLGAPQTEDGLLRWGFTEWRDLEAAVVHARANGAEDVVIMAVGMGAESALMLLAESHEARFVRAVILDSPVLDVSAVERQRELDSDLPGFIRSWGRGLAAFRFRVEWSRLDQVRLGAEFRVPMLVMHGSRDPIAPVEVSREFAVLRPDLVTYEEFPGAGHGQLWNVDPDGYEAAVGAFLDAVAGASSATVQAP